MGFYRMKQTFRCTLSKILDFKILYMYFLVSAFVKPVWNYVGIDTILELLHGGFHLFHLYIKIEKKNDRRLKYSLDTTL